MAEAKKKPKNVIYEVMAPDGKTLLEIEGPEDASEQQVLQAASGLYRQQLQSLAATTDVPVLDQFGQVVQPPQAQPRPLTIGERLTGAAETAGTLISGVPAAIGQVGGTLGALAAAGMRGEIGSPEAARLAQEVAMQQAQRQLYMPQTQAGQQMAQAVGQAAELVPPFLPMAAELQAASRFAPAAIARTPMTPEQEALRSAAAADTVIAAQRRATAEMMPKQAALRSMGAAETAMAAQRRATAEMMPIPFEGKSALTTGQATRNFGQLQFEKEIAKLEAGQPLRERVDNQTETLLRNFDALVDRFEPINVEPRELGRVVDKALVQRAEKRREYIRKAYDVAKKAGAMEAPVSMDKLAEIATDLTRFEGVSPNIKSIKNEAFRLGAIKTDENGNIVPGTVTINDSEILRQFVNEATDWTNPRESLFAKRFTTAIDEATEGAGGDAYKRARRLRAQFANEFENAALTSRLISSKPGSDDRRIAYEDVFDKIIVMSPVEEMNRTRSTLLRAGPEGKQAWKDLKAYGIQYIKDKSLSVSQMDARGNPIVSPDKLNKTIKAMDRKGKLESLYGKRQAQTLRDLADISSVIYTAPPGAINTSNNASALQVALDSVVTFGLTGVPAPVATTLKEASKYIKNRETRNRVQAALEGR